MQTLLVEDDEVIRERLERLLSGARFDVYAVGTAQEARTVMKTLVCPIVIIDRMLPDGDGLLLVRELRTTYAQHRVFLMLFSAKDTPEDEAQGFAAGADAYLGKRVSDDELLRQLETARAIVRISK